MAAKKEKKAAMLPKVIAGVKIPKVVREHLSALAKNPIVADLLAAGLVSLAAKLKGEAAPEATPAEPAKPAAKAPAKKAPVKKPAAPKAAAKPAAAKPAATKAPVKAAAAKPAAKPAAAKAPAKRPPAKRKPVTS